MTNTAFFFVIDGYTIRCTRDFKHHKSILISVLVFFCLVFLTSSSSVYCIPNFFCFIFLLLTVAIFSITTIKTLTAHLILIHVQVQSSEELPVYVQISYLFLNFFVGCLGSQCFHFFNNVLILTACLKTCLFKTCTFFVSNLLILVFCPYS